jgi:uroporphyrinogen-III synthase
MAHPPPALLMTRPRAASESFAAALAARGARFDAVVSPLFDIRFCDALPDMALLAGVIFTSANGVAAYRALGGRTDLPAYAVGTATAQAARAAGLRTWSAEGDAATLVEGLRARGLRGPLLHLRGAHTRGEVAQRLTGYGIRTREAVVYDQLQRPLSEAAKALLNGDAPVVAPLFSPRTARLLADEAGNAPLLVAAMSEAVAIAATSLHNCSVRVAARPDSAAMLDTVAGLLGEAAALDDGSARDAPRTDVERVTRRGEDDGGERG